MQLTRVLTIWASLASAADAQTSAPVWVPVGPVGGGHVRLSGTNLVVGFDQGTTYTLSDNGRQIDVKTGRRAAREALQAEAVSLWKAGHFTPSADGK